MSGANGQRVFEGRALECIRFPLGGIGAGCVYLTGRGGLAGWEIDGRPGADKPLPQTFGAVYANVKRHGPVARVLEARPMPPFSCSDEGDGLPRMASARFRGEFPFAYVEWADPAMPVGVALETFSPFIPGEVDDSAFPAAVLRYTLRNGVDERARVSLAWSLLNIVGNTNAYVEEEGVRGVLLEGGRNSMALLTPQRGVVFTTHWLRGPAVQALREFWDTFSKTGYLPYHEYGPAEPGRRDAASVGVRLALKPGESRSVTFYLTWHFPEIGALRQAYAEKWRNALAVGEALHSRLDELESGTRAFHNAVFTTTAPAAMIEAASASMAALRRPVIARAGGEVRVTALSESGSDVRAYTHSLAFLFPSLQRAAWETAAGDGHLDGLLAGIVCLYRDWKLSGDEAWLAGRWPGIRKAMLGVRAELGVPGGAVVVAYGQQIAGASPLPAFLYLAAAAACAEMAGWAGETELEDKLRGLFERGQQAVEEELWTGKLYVQAAGSESAAEQELAGGCLSTALLGAFLMQLAGLGHPAPPRRIRRALQETVSRNWRENLAGHANAGRPFAREGEPGLLMCTWLRGGRPGNGPLWADEVWAGVEYMVAAHCVYEGLVEDALRIVEGTRRRHDGERRNPWGGCESDARSMAAFALLPAWAGFSFDRGAGVIGFEPRVAGPFRTFWSIDGAWGTYEQNEAEARLGVERGKLILNRLDLPGVLNSGAWEMTLQKRVRAVRPDEFGSITFRRGLTIKAGQHLTFRKQD